MRHRTGTGGTGYGWFACGLHNPRHTDNAGHPGTIGKMIDLTRERVLASLDEARC